MGNVSVLHFFSLTLFSYETRNNLLSLPFCVISYFTNILTLPVVNGPTEGLALIYCGHFFTAIVGKASNYTILYKNLFVTSIHFFFKSSILKVLNGGLSSLESQSPCLVGCPSWTVSFSSLCVSQSCLLNISCFFTEITTSRVVLITMVAFAVIPTLAFRWVLWEFNDLAFQTLSMHFALLTSLFYSVSNVYKVIQPRKGSMFVALSMV